MIDIIRKHSLLIAKLISWLDNASQSIINIMNKDNSYTVLAEHHSLDKMLMLSVLCAAHWRSPDNALRSEDKDQLFIQLSNTSFKLFGLFILRSIALPGQQLSLNTIGTACTQLLDMLVMDQEQLVITPNRIYSCLITIIFSWIRRLQAVSSIWSSLVSVDGDGSLLIGMIVDMLVQQLPFISSTIVIESIWTIVQQEDITDSSDDKDDLLTLQLFLVIICHPSFSAHQHAATSWLITGVASQSVQVQALVKDVMLRRLPDSVLLQQVYVRALQQQQQQQSVGGKDMMLSDEHIHVLQLLDHSLQVDYLYCCALGCFQNARFMSSLVYLNPRQEGGDGMVLHRDCLQLIASSLFGTVAKLYSDELNRHIYNTSDGKTFKVKKLIIRQGKKRSAKGFQERAEDCLVEDWEAMLHLLAYIQGNTSNAVLFATIQKLCWRLVGDVDHVSRATAGEVKKELVVAIAVLNALLV